MDKKTIYLQPECNVLHIKMGQLFMASQYSVAPDPSISTMDYDGQEYDW